MLGALTGGGIHAMWLVEKLKAVHVHFTPCLEGLRDQGNSSGLKKLHGVLLHDIEWIIFYEVLDSVLDPSK